MILKINPKTQEIVSINSENLDGKGGNVAIKKYETIRLIKEFCKYNLYIPGLDNRKTNYELLDDGVIILDIPDLYIKEIQKLSKQILSAEKKYMKIKKVSPFEDGSLISIKVQHQTA